MLDRLYALETFGIKLGLENITRLCAALGHPERQFMSLHVAGTNGKGSVTAMVHAALLAAGLRAARYTSPHLTRLNERFVIGDAPPSDQELHSVAESVLDTIDRLCATGALGAKPTFFEATTAIAFELYRRAGVEIAVIEVGLGGRFDATNVVAAPVGAITSISMDHQQHLGHTLAAIAFEKAGIIKRDMTVVTGMLPAEATAVIANVARERGAAVVSATADTAVSATMEDGRATLLLETPDGAYEPVRLALRGEHQIGNAIVAVRMLEAARRQGVAVPRAAIEEGLATTRWPARLERLELPHGKRVLLDAAHNAEGAAALAAYLKRWHPERPALVVGVMADKDVDEILGALLPHVSTVIATAVRTPRALPAEALRQRVVAADPARDARVDVDPRHAVDRALAEHDTVCVAGSIYLAGAVRDALEARAILH